MQESRRGSWRLEGALLAAALAFAGARNVQGGLSVSGQFEGHLSVFDSSDVLKKQPASLLEQGHGKRQRRYRLASETDEVVQLATMPAKGDTSGTQKWLEFWKGEEGAVRKQVSATGSSTDFLSQGSESKSGTRYFTFDTDAGGFNNMRMAFEYFVDLAHRSGRTLVLPPQEGWYLIDWGPLNAHNKADEQWIKGTKKSTYGEFFDIDYMKQKGMKVLTAAEFYDRERSRLGIPADADPRENLQNSPDPNPYKKWLDKAPGPYGCDDGQQMAFTDTPLLHYGLGESRFLQCLWQGLGGSDMYSVGSNDGRDLIHYNPTLFEMASHPVAALGASRYMALHLRRNDFQYDQAPSAGEAGKLVRSLEGRLKPLEAVYVASDEVDQNWWKALRLEFDARGHKLVTLADFKDDANLQGENGLSSRNAGLVEQIVCSAARSFIGTSASTFSAGIQLLRQELAEARKTKSSLAAADTEYHVGHEFIDA